MGRERELLEFKKEGSLVSDEKVEDLGRDLKPELERIREELGNGYSDPRGCVNLPSDDQNLRQVQSLVEEKKALDPEYIVVAGIGGSNLGTIAVYRAVLGKLYNQKDSGTKILFAETSDPDHVKDIIDIIEPVLEEGGNVVLNGVSKSGGTTETVANFELLEQKIMEYKEEPEKFIAVTTGEESPLHRMAEEKNYSTLEIPEDVGGRFSVFTPVGLFPLGLAGVDIEELLEGAGKIREKCLQVDISDNPAARSAASIYENKRQGRDIYDLFLYSKDFEMLGKWYRQLMAESLGKEYSRKGEKVDEGVTPLVSVGSTDLHSLMQLYMGGPDDKYHCFVWPHETKEKVSIPEKQEYENLVEDIQGRELGEILEAILKGVNTAFEDKEIPYSVIKLRDKSEKSIGAFLQFKMIEVILLGHLMNVDPFDQPAVESYKEATRRNLER